MTNLERHHYRTDESVPDDVCAECEAAPGHFIHKPPSQAFLDRMQRSTRRAMKLEDDLEVLPGLTDQQRYAVSVTIRNLAQKFHTEYLKAKKTREQW
jgi:hypothetical protein